MQSEDTWMELHVLHRHGWSIAALAREFGLDWRTARTTKRIVGEAWAEEHGLLTPVSRRLLARIEGQETLVPLPEPVSARQVPAAVGETVEVRPLAVYAERVR